MCPLNYWDMGLSFWVFLGIFLAFDRKLILGIWDIFLFCFRDTGYWYPQKRVTIFVLLSFSFVCLFCFSSVNIFKVKLVVSFFLIFTPLSTIFQLYRGCQFYWWGKPKYSEKNHRPVTSHYHIVMYRVHLSINGVRTHKFSGDQHSLHVKV
jgi:hypothetical protein